MPRVDHLFLNCAVYLYPSKSGADGGVQAGGNGFLLAVPQGSPEPLHGRKVDQRFTYHIGEQPENLWAKAPPHIYVVTNKHVADENSWLRLSTIDDVPTVFEAERWHGHDTSDLAVYPVPIREHRARNVEALTVIPHDVLLSQDDLSALDVGVGDDTFTVGRFIGHDGRLRNLPVARFGSIAMMPSEPIHFKKSGYQNCFLVESRTIQGYSGSPVFLNIPPWELKEYHESTLRHKLYSRVMQYDPWDERNLRHFTRLLGIVIGFLNDIYQVPEENTGMMAAVPSWELLELLNYPKLTELRKQQVEEWKRDGRSGTLA